MLERPIFPVLALFLGFLLFFEASPLLGGEEPEIDRLTLELNGLLARAEGFFDSPDQSRAIPDLNEIIKRLEGYAQTRQMFPAWRDIYVSALVVRGQILYGLGEFQKAEEDFKEILQANPDYRMDPMQVSPKIVADFDEVRNRSIGHLTVRSAPPVAEVKIDGQLLGVTPLVGKNLTRGEYRLTVSLLGYKEHEEIIAVKPGVLIDTEVALEMNAGDCVLFTSPPGVSIYLDGSLKGHSSGEAPARDADFIRKHGLDPKEVSAPFILPLVSLGKHKLTLSKRGWTTKSYPLEIHEGENRLEPFTLTPSRCSLVVKSSPPGASVFLDDLTEPLGKTPLRAQDVHTGRVKIRVVFDGKETWSELLDLKKDQRIELACSPRPTCLFTGILDPTGSYPSLTEKLTEQWITLLHKLQLLNRILPGEIDYPTDLFLRDSKARDLPSLRKHILDVAKEHGTDLVLLGFIGDSDALSGASLTIELLSVHHEGADKVTLSANDIQSHDKWINKISRADLQIERPWIGAVLIDTTIMPGAHVAFVTAHSPAAAAALTAGDVIVETNGQPLKESSDFAKFLDKTRPGEALSLRVQRGKEQLNVSLEVGSSPRVLPLHHEDLLYNLALEEMLLQRKLASNEKRRIAQLNLGICLMHFGEYEKALSTSLQTLQLDRAVGINTATVQYYVGECFRCLGRKTEAVTAYEKAVSIAGGTFEYDGGLQVKPAAEARLAELACGQRPR